MKWSAKPVRWYGEWTRWFAWHPIRVKDSMVWLEWVERRDDGLYDEIHWEYRQ